MTLLPIFVVYLLCLTSTNVYSKTFYPLMRNNDNLNSILQSRQKRHTPLDTSKLCKAFGCKNGHCKESELRKYRIVCECFSGYKGTLCDRLQCPYPCGKHGTCVKTGQSLRCKCNVGYYGLTCNKRAKLQKGSGKSMGNQFKGLSGIAIPASIGFRTSQPLFKVNQMKGWFSSSISSKLSDIKFSDFHSHAVIDTSVKPDVCAPGFQCYHGKCNREALAYGMFQCICKQNFTGLFCEKKCTLKCQNGGHCMVLDDGHQLCSCPFNYGGNYCEKPE